MEHIKHLSLGWLVGAAARKAGRASLRGVLGGAMTAAALLFAGCSSDDTMGGETKTEQTATVIRVTVGAGISDPTPDPSPTGAGSSADDGAAAPLPSRGGAGVGSVTHSAGSSATTRSTVDVTTDGETGKKTRTLQFTSGDRLYIVRELADGKCLAGELTMAGAPAADGTQATFEGDLTVYDGTGAPASYDFQGGNPLAGATATLLHAGMKETDAEGGDYSIDGATKALTFADATGVAATVEALMTKGLVVSGLYDAENDRFPLSATQPILNCTIAGLTAGATFAMAYSVSADGSTYDDITTGTVTADAQGTATFACLATEEYNDGQASHTNIYHRIRLTNNGDGADTYTVSIGQKALQSKVYNLSRIWYDGAMHRLVDLDGVTTTTHPSGLTLKDGDVVKGTLNAKSNSSQRLQISIDNDATVILKGVVIRGYDDTSYKWAGLTCLGDATIILAVGSENTVKGFNQAYPGIFIAEGKTLTIQGSGSLTASPHDGGTTNSYGAGIGGTNGVACGSIVIEGGDITATGGSNAAGIGGARGKSCGTISISGGTVTATSISSSAGIGCGYQGTCGDITISGTAHVTATGGGGAGYGSGAGIGSGDKGTVSGTISISGSANVTATGGADSAGIGSGNKGTVSGTISITGGTVTATGGLYAAGIGSGNDGSCGSINIGSDITQVVAKRYGSSYNFIGKGSGGGTCGTVNIDGVENATTESMFPHLTSTVSGNTWTLTNPSN